MNRMFGLKDYWSLFKLSCRPYIYRMPYINVMRPVIAIFVVINALRLMAVVFMKGGFGATIFLFCMFILPIINPYYFMCAIKYKTSDWYKNTGYLPSEVCADAGLFGEYHATMDFSTQKGKNGKIYNGLIIPKPDGSFTEIDVVLVSESLITVIEAKARGGVFSGNIYDAKWVQKIGSQTNELQNPVLQNQNHINFLYLYLYKELNKTGSTSKLMNIHNFINSVYFAGDPFINVQNPLEHIYLLLPSRRMLSKQPNKYKLEEVKAITDVLDALPKYTPEEKRKMFNRREIQYRNGEFIHKITYYPVAYQYPESETNQFQMMICMDAGSYQFYQCSDGLWRPDVFAHQKGQWYFKGEPCDTLQEAVKQQKEMGWVPD